MNFAESASVEQLLQSRNWHAADSIHTCDLLIVNTCSVRITAETRVFGRLSLFSAMKKKRPFALLLMGCMAERLHDSIKKDFPQLDYVVGMFERQSFSAIFTELEEKEKQVSTPFIPDSSVTTVEFFSKELNETPAAGTYDDNRQYHFAACSYTNGSFQSFVPIMNGCNNFCTYCIVPYVRGREISRPVEDILREIAFLSSKGVKEITLLGQNVNSYRGTDPVTGEIIDFPALLARVAAACTQYDSIQWIRFISSHPKDMSDTLIETMAEQKRVCKSVHLPVQHGSDTILKRMNRHYTAAQYLSLVKKLKQKIPHVVLTTDILIGFPGETQEDFEKTLKLMEEVQFDSAFMYHYNPREGTTAFDFPNRIADSIKINRLQQVIELQMRSTEHNMRKRLGSRAAVLVESPSRNNPNELFGHTEQGEMVVLAETCDSSYIGRIIPVELHSIKGRTFRALVCSSF